MPGVLAFAIELERPVQVAVVGEGQGVHAHALWPARPARAISAGAVEQAVVRVAVEMNEGARGVADIERSLLRRILTSRDYSVVRQAGRLISKKPSATGDRESVP